MEAKKTDLGASLGLLILRLGACGFLAAHGWGKVQMVLAGELDKFADPIGIGVGPSLVLAAGAEFVCSLLVMAGFATRLAALPPAFTMAVAAFVFHAADPWTMSGPGPSKEPALLFLTAFVALACLGPGEFSVDAILAKRRAAAPRPGAAPSAAKPS